MGHILDGKALAQHRKASLRSRVSDFLAQRGRPPTLAVILVGKDPASQAYVKFKMQMCAELSINSRPFLKEEGISAVELHALIDKLNEDDGVDGILLQLPLPAHLIATDFIKRIAPHKDVDGLHPYNQGLLFQGRPTLIPCTPKGCLQLIQESMPYLQGKRAVVLGRSVLVGRPMGALLLNHDVTVTYAHSHTLNLKALCKEADILVAATGMPHLIGREHVKPGAVVIDVGQHRENNLLRGDVATQEVLPIVSHVTPVPGGVGPMTIINLMENILDAATLLP